MSDLPRMDCHGREDVAAFQRCDNGPPTRGDAHCDSKAWPGSLRRLLDRHLILIADFRLGVWHWAPAHPNPSMAEARRDRKEQQIAFSSAFFMVASIGIAAALLLSIAAQVVPATWIAGATQQVYVSTIRQCVPVVCLLGLVQLLANVVQRAQAGFQELHIYNLAGGLGNVLMILGIVIFLWLPTSVLSLTLCLYGSQSLALLGNMAGFFWRRPWLWPKILFREHHHSPLVLQRRRSSLAQPVDLAVAPTRAEQDPSLPPGGNCRSCPVQHLPPIRDTLGWSPCNVHGTAIWRDL